MKKNVNFILLLLALAVFNVSCKRDINPSNNEYVKVTFGIGGFSSRQIVANPADYLEDFTYELYGNGYINSSRSWVSYGSEENPIICKLGEDGSSGYVLQNSEGENLNPLILKGEWTFYLNAVSKDEARNIAYTAETETIEFSDSTADISFDLKINNSESNTSTGHFRYTITYPAEDYIGEDSLVYELRDSSGNLIEDLDVTGPELKTVDGLSYYEAVIEKDLPYGIKEYTITFKVVSSSTYASGFYPATTYLKTERIFSVYPCGETIGSFDGKEMPLNNSYSFTIPSEIIEKLNEYEVEVDPYLLSRDWYTIFQSISLPDENSNIRIHCWYYTLDSDTAEPKTRYPIDYDEYFGFKFNKNHDVRGNVTLGFDYFINSEDFILYPADPYENSLLLNVVEDSSTNIWSEKVVESITLYPMDYSGKYSIQDGCSWKIDGKKITFDDSNIYLGSYLLGSWGLEDGVKHLTFSMRDIVSCVYDGIFTNPRIINITCSVPHIEDGEIVDYGEVAYTIYTKNSNWDNDWDGVLFPEDVMEGNYLMKFSSKVKNKDVGSKDDFYDLCERFEIFSTEVEFSEYESFSFGLNESVPLRKYDDTVIEEFIPGTDDTKGNLLPGTYYCLPYNYSEAAMTEVLGKNPQEIFYTSNALNKTVTEGDGSEHICMPVIHLNEETGTVTVFTKALIGLLDTGMAGDNLIITIKAKRYDEILEGYVYDTVTFNPIVSTLY